MTLLEPAEIRYTVISVFTLMIITSMMFFTGVAATSWTPSNPDAPGSDGCNISEQCYWDQLSDSNIFGANDVLNSMLDPILQGVGTLVGIMTQWNGVIAEAGWASGFIIVPSLVMVLILGGVVVKIVNALPYT